MPFPASPRAVVTGAASGLGRAFCVELARRGARVIAADVNLEGAEETRRMIGDSVAAVVRCDVARLEDVQALADKAEEAMGGVDLVVNNAGVGVGGAVGEVPMEDWSWILGVNLLGPVHGCHVFVPRMKRQGSGHVLNVASAAGLLAAANMAPYNVTKAGVVALSETLCAELDGTGVGVTVLCPTFFKTNILASGRTQNPELNSLATRLMERAKSQADDVARLALDGAAAGHLYVVPHPDGRWMWRMKRAAPEAFAHRLPAVIRTLRSRLAAKA